MGGAGRARGDVHPRHISGANACYTLSTPDHMLPQEMFDFDDALVYEPSQTAALVLTGEDEEAEAAALAVRELHSWQQMPLQHCVAGMPRGRD